MSTDHVINPSPVPLEVNQNPGIQKVIRLAHRDIIKLTINAEVSHISQLYAAICISDPINSKEPTPEFPSWVRPTLHLTFSLFNTAYLYGSDKVFRKRYVEQVKSGHIRLPEKRDAEKIIAFCDALAKDNGRWTLYVSCPYGYGRSTSISRFISGLLRVPEIGLSYPHLEPYDHALTKLLNIEYTHLHAESLKNEPNADSQSVVRREESDPLV